MTPRTAAGERRLIRLLTLLQIALIALGLGLAAVGYWRLHYTLANIGGLVLSAGALIGGVETMLTRRLHFTGEHGISSFYRRLGAVGIGLSFAATGLGLLLFGGLGAAGQEKRLIEMLLRFEPAYLTTRPPTVGLAE